MQLTIKDKLYIRNLSTRIIQFYIEQKKFVMLETSSSLQKTLDAQIENLESDFMQSILLRMPVEEKVQQQLENDKLYRFTYTRLLQELSN